MANLKPSTYLQSSHALRIEDHQKSCMQVQYTRIKLKHFQESKNRGLVGDSVSRSSMRDEGTTPRSGLQEQAPNHLKLRW
jgi:hypothetical protein